MESDIKKYQQGDRLKFKTMLHQRLTEFINTCHNPEGSGGGRFCATPEGAAGTPGGKAAGKIAGLPGSQLSASKVKDAENKGKVGPVTRLGFDTIPDEAIVDNKRGAGVVNRIAAVPGFESFRNRKDRAVLGEIAQRQSENIEDMYETAMQIDNGQGIAKAHADWYPWVNRWAHDESDRLGFPPEAIMAATAVLSPSTDWPSNVAWATQIANVMQHEKTITVQPEWVASQEMAALASHEAKIKIHERENKKLIAQGLEPKPFTIQPPELGKYQHLIGQKLSDLNDTEVAIAIRGAHEQYGKAVRQLGGMAGLGDPVNVAKPQSYPNMAKAISILRNPTTANIDAQLGGSHKVRSFYQNMRDPLNTKEADVTVDSHHIGLAIGLPVVGTSKTMKSIYDGPKIASTGLVGTYPVTVEATRIATERINKKYGTNYTPNQIQSITWEAQRALYANKPEAMIKKIGEIRSAYWAGKINKKDMLAQVEQTRLSGKGYTNPTIEEVRTSFLKEVKKGVK